VTAITHKAREVLALGGKMGIELASLFGLTGPGGRRGHQDENQFIERKEGEKNDKSH